MGRGRGHLKAGSSQDPRDGTDEGSGQSSRDMPVEPQVRPYRTGALLGWLRREATEIGL